MIELIKKGLGIAGSIYGGIAGASETEKLRKSLERRRMDNTAWYLRRKYESPLQRRDAQQLLGRAEQLIIDENNRARAISDVVGGTPASEAIAKERGTRALAQAVSDIAARSDARRDAAERVYMAREDGIERGLDELRKYRRGQVAAATKALSSLFD